MEPFDNNSGRNTSSDHNETLINHNQSLKYFYEIFTIIYKPFVLYVRLSSTASKYYNQCKNKSLQL